MRKVRGLLGLLVGGAMLVLAGCGGGASTGGGGGGSDASKFAAVDLSKPPAQPVKIRMGWGIPAEEIHYVMMKKPEILKHHGKWYTLEWFQFQGTAPQAQALAAKSLDAGTVASLSLAQAVEKAQLDVVVTGQMIGEKKDQSFSTTWLVKEDSPIKSLADLKGKIVGVNVYGASLDYIARTKIKEAGLKPEVDVKIVEIGFGLMDEALRSGKIDVGVFPQPFLYNAKNKGGVRELFKLTDVQPDFVQLINVFDREFINKNPGVMVAFQEDWKTAAKFVMENRDETIKIMSEISKMPVELLQKFLITKNDYYRTNTGMPDLKALQLNWDYMAKEGHIKAKMDVNKVVIPDLIK